jgi:hypothetical protein
VSISKPRAVYATSSFCASGECVAVAQRDGLVLVRDAKHPRRPPLEFSREEWQAFILGVKAGEFDK